MTVELAEFQNSIRWAAGRVEDSCTERWEGMRGGERACWRLLVAGRWALQIQTTACP
jgi:hypothetical protein